MSETETVRYEVLGIEPVRGSARLIALAVVEIEIAGVPITLQGVQVLRAPDGRTEIRSPAFRDAGGVWRSAIILPDALRDALGAEVLAVLPSAGLG